MVSFWFAPDNTWPAAVSQIAPHSAAVTSIMVYCGIEVSDAGTVVGGFADTCAGFFPAVAKLGIRSELVLNSGNCSIAAYRVLWADHAASPQVLLAAVLAANASGLQVDLEPQADNCAGDGTGTAADAVLFAGWLAAVRALLNAHGARLTVAVASWSAVLREYAVLAPSVDRLQTMETYNGDSEAQWRSYFDEFVAATPLGVAGIGLGGWTDGKPSWWEMAAAAQVKVNASVAAGIRELAVFRIVPDTQPQWPLAFWWPVLESYIS